MIKNITCFICGLGSGGAEHQLSLLSNFLSERGYNINLVTFSSVADHYPLNKSIERIRLGINKNKIGQLIDIWRFFLTTKSELVISFGQRENFLCILPLLFRSKIKIIAGERNTTYGKPSNIERVLYKVLYGRANSIVPNSYSQEKYIKVNAPKFASKVKTITNYTEIERFVYSPYPNNQPVRFGVFCRYSKQKNYIRFAKAIKSIVNKGYDKFIIDWYGDRTYKGTAPNPHYEIFNNLLIEYNLQSYLKLHDRISDVAFEMSKCDAIILPSLYEGFSNTLSETICCGRPGLCGNVADNGLIVQDGINGYLFNPESIEDIANCIIKFLELPLRNREIMANNSREKALLLFDKNRFINEYIKLIK